MSQPFVVSLKLVGEDAGASTTIEHVKREVQELRAEATRAMTGPQRNLEAMLGIGGSGRGIDEARADITAYGAALDDTRAKFVPLFSLERQHAANLAMIDSAYKVGAISAAEQAAAIDRENAAHQRAIAALDSHTHAINVNAAANGRAMAQRTNLIFQLNDVAVSLAGGMNPAMVAMQQGSQISAIWGPSEGGLGRALQETGKIALGLATKFWPVLIAVGLVSAGVAGMRHEIEETSGVAVSFGDVFMAVFQVLGGYLYDAFKPAIEAIKGWFEWAWDGAVAGTKLAINFMIASVLTLIEQVRMAHEIIPQLFKLAGQAAANFFIDAIEVMVNRTLKEINGLTAAINAIFKTNIAEIDPVNLGGLEFDTEATVDRISGIWKSYQATVGEIANTDYAGDFFSDVQTQAIKNYNDGLKDTAKSAKTAAAGLKEAKDAAKAFEAEIAFYKDTFRSFFQDFRHGLSEGKSFWDALGEAGVNALDKIADRAMGMALDGIFDMITGAIFGGGGVMGSITGGVFSPSIGDPWAGLRVGNNAGGTNNWGGGWTWVGEEGPELLNVSPGAKILPNPVSRDLVAANQNGGAGSFTFAPTNVFSLEGSNVSEGQLQAMLDQRDRQLNEQFAGQMRYYLDNPYRTGT